MPKVIQVIQSHINIGKGVKGDPFRQTVQYHTMEGEFLAEQKYFTAADVVEIIKSLGSDSRSQLEDELKDGLPVEKGICQQTMEDK